MAAASRRCPVRRRPRHAATVGRPVLQPWWTRRQGCRSLATGIVARPGSYRPAHERRPWGLRDACRCARRAVGLGPQVSSQLHEQPIAEHVKPVVQVEYRVPLVCAAACLADAVTAGPDVVAIGDRSLDGRRHRDGRWCWHQSTTAARQMAAGRSHPKYARPHRRQRLRTDGGHSGSQQPRCGASHLGVPRSSSRKISRHAKIYSGRFSGPR